MPDAAGPQIVAHPAATRSPWCSDGCTRPSRSRVPSCISSNPPANVATPGIEELQQQTVSLLSFQPLPKKVFDTQLSLCMLAQLGEEAAAPLQDVEERIERHLATLLERIDGVPMPSLRLIQAPGFSRLQFFVLD